MIDQAKLDEWKRLAAEAKAGPWTVYQCACMHDGERLEWACGYIEGDSLDHSYDECHHPLPIGDAEFIAAAREAVPALIAEVERLCRELESRNYG